MTEWAEPPQFAAGPAVNSQNHSGFVHVLAKKTHKCNPNCAACMRASGVCHCQVLCSDCLSAAVKRCNTTPVPKRKTRRHRHHHRRQDRRLLLLDRDYAVYWPACLFLLQPLLALLPASFAATICMTYSSQYISESFTRCTWPSVSPYTTFQLKSWITLKPTQSQDVLCSCMRAKSAVLGECNCCLVC